MRKYLNLKANIALGLIFAFLANMLGPMPIARADSFFLPVPGQMVALSPAFSPAVLKGIKLDPKNPFQFHFYVDKGDSSLSQEELKQESAKLIKYFLASLTIPEKDLWVNLSPYEKDRIVPQEFGQTEMGRDLLAQDYLLKQITASLIYPESQLGKEFWAKVYAQAQAKYGTTNIPINTFNKVWIVPEKAVVYENAGVAFVLENHLKVMLEQDYLALEKNTVIPAQAGIQNQNDTNAIGSQIVREIVIPALTKEVNEGKNFTQLRQVFYSLILATWYKKKIKDSILNKVYANQRKISGVSISVEDKDKIYQEYLKAFKKGVYNYIKEEQDPAANQVVPRKYFSGGVTAFKMSAAMTTLGLEKVSPEQRADMASVAKSLVDVSGDMAMTNKSSSSLAAGAASAGKELVARDAGNVTASDVLAELEIVGPDLETYLVSAKAINEMTMALARESEKFLPNRRLVLLYPGAQWDVVEPLIVALRLIKEGKIDEAQYYFLEPNPVKMDEFYTALRTLSKYVSIDFDADKLGARINYKGKKINIKYVIGEFPQALSQLPKDINVFFWHRFGIILPPKGLPHGWDELLNHGDGPLTIFSDSWGITVNRHAMLDLVSDWVYYPKNTFANVDGGVAFGIDRNNISPDFFEELIELYSGNRDNNRRQVAVPNVRVYARVEKKLKELMQSPDSLRLHKTDAPGILRDLFPEDRVLRRIGMVHAWLNQRELAKVNGLLPFENRFNIGFQPVLAAMEYLLGYDILVNYGFNPDGNLGQMLPELREYLMSVDVEEIFKTAFKQDKVLGDIVLTEQLLMAKIYFFATLDTEPLLRVLQAGKRYMDVAEFMSDVLEKDPRIDPMAMEAFHKNIFLGLANQMLMEPAGSSFISDNLLLAREDKGFEIPEDRQGGLFLGAFRLYVDGLTDAFFPDYFKLKNQRLLMPSAVHSLEAQALALGKPDGVADQRAGATALVNLVQGSDDFRRPLIEARSALKDFDIFVTGYSYSVNKQPKMKLSFAFRGLNIFTEAGEEAYSFELEAPRSRRISIKDMLNLKVSGKGVKGVRLEDLLRRKGLLDLVIEGPPFGRTGFLAFDQESGKVIVHDDTPVALEAFVTIDHDDKGRVVSIQGSDIDNFTRRLSEATRLLDYHAYPGDNETITPSYYDLNLMFKKKAPLIITNASGRGALWVIKDLEKAKKLNETPFAKEHNKFTNIERIDPKQLEGLFISAPIDLSDAAMNASDQTAGKYEPDSEQQRILEELGLRWDVNEQKLYYGENFKPLKLKSKLVFVRHGDTLLIQKSHEDKKPRYQGNIDQAENQLSPKGKQQASGLVAQLQELIQRSKKAIRYFSSPLSRAKDTAEPSRQQLNFNLEIRPGLREIGFGKFENLTSEEILEKFGEEGLLQSNAYRNNNAVVRLKGGEDFIQLLKRAKMELLALDNDLNGDIGVLFSHGTLGAACSILLGEANSNPIEWRKNLPKTAEPFVLYDPDAALTALRNKNGEDYKSVMDKLESDLRKLPVTVMKSTGKERVNLFEYLQEIGSGLALSNASEEVRMEFKRLDVLSNEELIQDKEVQALLSTMGDLNGELTLENLLSRFSEPRGVGLQHHIGTSAGGEMMMREMLSKGDLQSDRRTQAEALLKRACLYTALVFILLHRWESPLISSSQMGIQSEVMISDESNLVNMLISDDKATKDKALDKISKLEDPDKIHDLLNRAFYLLDIDIKYEEQGNLGVKDLYWGVISILEKKLNVGGAFSFRSFPERPISISPALHESLQNKRLGPMMYLWWATHPTIRKQLAGAKMAGNQAINDQVRALKRAGIFNIIELASGTEYAGQFPIWNKDNAQLANKGGIDFNLAQMSLQVKKEGEGFRFDFNGVEVDAAQVTGVTFTIRQMTPVVNLPQILGLNQPVSSSESLALY